MTKEQFVSRSKDKFGCKFSYVYVAYTNMHTRVTITCPIHGDFEITPQTHLNSKTGCQRCSGKHKPTVEDLIKTANVVHHNKYDYSLVTTYENQRSRLRVICPEHGLFEVSAANHLNGAVGCRECAKLKFGAYHKRDTNSFVAEARLVHGDKYDYSNVVYHNTHTKVTIVCPTHGLFEQTPASHTKGKCGCPKCKPEKCIGGYGVTRFINNPELKNKPSKLYVVRLWNNEEQFIKIGVTRKSVNARMSGLISLTEYHYEELMCSNGTAYDTFLCEQNIKKELRMFKYRPLKKFPGHTECFDCAALPAILSELTEHDLFNGAKK